VLGAQAFELFQRFVELPLRLWGVGPQLERTLVTAGCFFPRAETRVNGPQVVMGGGVFRRAGRQFSQRLGGRFGCCVLEQQAAQAAEDVSGQWSVVR
jgi:hypothetical protein